MRGIPNLLWPAILLTIGLAAPIMVSGAGAWSVDRRIAQWIASHGPTTHGADRLRHAHVH